jgi:Ca2+:H+ antiporter
VPGSVFAGLSHREQLLLLVVLAATVAAAACHYLSAPAVAAFAAATLALAGLAWVVSFSTEQVGERFGPAVTGVLQSTLGNLPELFIVIFALRAGETIVAQTSILGSLFANALLVLGLVVIAGAWQSRENLMRFSSRLPNDTATLLILACFVIVLIGISVAANDHASRHVKAISIAGAVVLLITYVAWVVPYLRSDTAGQDSLGPARIGLSAAVVLLVVGGVGSAFVSDWFVAALAPAMQRLHLSEAFAGIVVVGIAGNAVENTTGVVLAWKGKADLAISVVKNSVAQVAAFLYPVLVLISLLFASSLTFSLAPVYIGALLVAALAVWQITGDGQAAAFEGTALVALYVVLAVLTLYE